MKRFGTEALASLSTDDVQFLKSLPKAELHAHLNGCIPISCLQELSRQQVIEPSHDQNEDTVKEDIVSKGLKILEQGIELTEIHQFFDLFPAIYSLTSTPEALRLATRATLEQFLKDGWLGEGEPAQCDYLEIRTTPRQNENMSREVYLDAVLKEVEKYPREQCALIVSLDRRMDNEAMLEIVNIAVKLKQQGRRVVGIDLCGTPTVGDPHEFLSAFKLATDSGLRLTLHIAETTANTEEDVMTLLKAEPSRLGHATFLSKEAQDVVLSKKIPIEICLSSNLLCKTVDNLQAHHINYWLEHDIPLAICTDDTLVFRNNLLEEYAMLMASAPLGLGLSREAISRLAQMSMEARFD
ncbi:Metallo-dependent hydrolase [Serendipita vermifera]|nr:Metallo-dependent hydrolase [Serendipita vermifera]